MTAMQSPRRIASAPSATLWVPVAQADTMQMLWPMAPVSMAIIPEVESTRPLAMNVGGTARGPRSWSVAPGLDHELLAAGAGAEDDADLLAVRVVDLEARVGDRLLGGRHAVLEADLGPPDRLGVEPRERVEVVDLAGRLGLVSAHVEAGDLAEAAPAVDEVVPGGPLVVADRADDAEAGDGDAAVVVGSAHSVRFSSRSWSGVRRGLGWGSVKGTARRSGAAGSSVASASTSGAIRLMRPVRTRPGPTSTNVSTPSADHPLDGGHPVDAGREVVDELRAAGLGGGQRAAVGVGAERADAGRRTGRRRGRRASPRPPRP